MQQRIASLDLIRGVAVLAILLVNIYSFALPYQAYDTPLWLIGVVNEVDVWVYAVQQLFVNGRFITLFSVLFGAGLALQMQRMLQDGRDARKLTLRRLRWLLLFGLVHGVFIWYGDILTIYALVGLIVYRWANKPAAWLFKWAFITYALGCASMALLMWVTSAMNLPVSEDPWDAIQLTSAGLLEQAELWTGPYAEQVELQALFFFVSVAGAAITFAWMVAGMMFCGMGLYHSGFFQRGLTTSRIVVLFAAGLVLALVDLWIKYDAGWVIHNAVLNPLPYIAASFMAAVYAALMVRWAAVGGWLAGALQSAGQMAFTLYISQSVVMVLLFRWLAPDLWGQLSRLECVAVVLIYSLVQVIFAVAWRRYCGQGPLEGLWRWLVLR
jgi:uncharacterized protein